MMMGDVIVYGLFLLAPAALGAALYGFARRRRRADRPAGFVRLAVGNGLLLLFLLSTLLLAAESYYRFWYDATDSFALTRTSQRWAARHMQKNDMGLRDNVDYQSHPFPGERRITFLGDSFTIGHGIVDVEDRFANRIRKRRGGEWDILVLASNGHDTGSEIAWVRKYNARNLEFGDVVLVYTLNDVADIHPKWRATFDRISARAQDQNFLIRHSYFLNLLYYRRVVARDPDVANYYGFIKDAYDGPLWEEQRRRLRELRDECDQRGGRLFVVTFPFMHQLGEAYEYRQVHERLGEFWDELGVPHLDLLPVFEKHSDEVLTVNAYDAHPNERANELAAEAIEKFLDSH